MERAFRARARTSRLMAVATATAMAAGLVSTGALAQDDATYYGCLTPESLLVDGDRITLLDFDDAGYGWHLFDIATALAMATLREDFDGLRDAFVAGYRRQRQLTDEHLARLPLFLALRGATYVAWVHTRSHTQFAKDLGGLILRAAVDTARRYLET